MGWYNYKYRIYDPAIGRFVEVDPIADDFADLSPYNYAGNEPTGAIDLHGLQKWETTLYNPPVRDTDAAGREAYYNGIKKGAGDSAKMTDANDVAVLVTALFGDARNIDGSDAGKGDVVAAGIGIFLPGVSGSLAKKSLVEVADQAKVLSKSEAEEVVGGGLFGGKNVPDDKLSVKPNKRGNAPIGEDGKPIELHHRNQTNNGPIDEMTSTDHRGPGNYSKNHTNTGQNPSKINRREFNKQKKQYWKDEWDSGRFDNLPDK